MTATVERAVVQAKRPLVHERLGHLEWAVGPPLPGERRGSIDELKEITKYP